MNYAEICIIKRDGKREDFSISKIKNAIGKAFHASGIDNEDKLIAEITMRVISNFVSPTISVEEIQDLVEKQIIEVAPLAYMRGRTLDDSFIILDEAQNTTPEQMKMFLTRMGVGSKVVVTGDVTQIDLPERTRSGLVDALHVLKNVNGIAQCYFTEKDVVRHRLVQEIIKAYEKAAHPEK